MRKIVIIVVLVGCLAGLAQAYDPPIGTVLFDEDFEGGTYTDGPLIGQTASHGLLWAQGYTAGALDPLPGASRGDFGYGPSKSAGIDTTSTDRHSARVPLLPGSGYVGDNSALKVSADIALFNVHGNTRLVLESNSGKHMDVGWFWGNSISSKIKQGQCVYSPSSNPDANPYWGQIIEDTLGFDRYWVHVELTVDQPAGMIYTSYQQFGGDYEEYGEGIQSGSASFDYAATSQTFRPSGLQVAFDDYGPSYDTGLGIDNIRVEVVPSTLTPVTTLSMTADNGIWEVYGSVSPDNNEGLASFLIDVVGRDGATVTSSTNESPTGVDAEGSYGFDLYRSDGTNGLGIGAGQKTLYDGGNDPDLDALVLQGVGQTAGSRANLGVPDPITWAAPILLASGTYSGSGWLDVTGLGNALTSGSPWSGPGNVEEAYWQGVSILAPPTAYNRADVTGDNFVGADDLVAILTNWGASGAGVTWEMGDCAPYGDGSNPGDDFVGADDYVEVLTFWGVSYPPEPIPEPAAFSLLLLGGLALLRRR